MLNDLVTFGCHIRRMPSAPSTISMPNTAHDSEQELMILADQTIRMVTVVQTLVTSQRHVDLDGLQDQIGLLCAKALDLSPGRTGLVRMELRRLRDAMDELHDTMRQNAA